MKLATRHKILILLNLKFSYPVSMQGTRSPLEWFMHKCCVVFFNFLSLLPIVSYSEEITHTVKLLYSNNGCISQSQLYHGYTRRFIKQMLQISRHHFAEAFLSHFSPFQNCIEKIRPQEYIGFKLTIIPTDRIWRVYQCSS